MPDVEDMFAAVTAGGERPTLPVLLRGATAMKREDLLARIQSILDRLREQTDACRTTLRLDLKDYGFHCDDVAAESRRNDSVRTLKGQTSLDQRKAAAVKWLDANRRTFIMTDTLNPWDKTVAPEREVIEIYGIRSEMVAPVYINGALDGWISVHETRGVREWSGEEVATLEQACEEMAGAVGV